jgi:N-acetylglucosamine-6-phosphate deacetylase
MNPSRICARHYATSQVVEIACAEGLIRDIQVRSHESVVLDAQWVAPALFDLQINGCNGRSFNSSSLTSNDIHHVVDACRAHGIGGFCATVITNSPTALATCLRTLGMVCDTDRKVAATIPAFHLEGPYVSPENGPRGAHPRQYVRPPDWDEFCRLQEAAGGRIRLVTLTPEYQSAVGFIERLVATGVTAAIGHTAANGRQIRDAIAAGARLSTHLGNGAHAILPRHPNYIWEQLAADELWASIICDGHHLPPSVIRTIMKVKTPARTILTCDAGSLAGSPPGRYREWDQELEVLPEGKIVLPGSDYLAGSWVFTDTCIGNAIAHAGITLWEAIDMAGARPRELLGLPPRRLEPNEPADLILFNWTEGGTFNLVATIIGGTWYQPHG